ncbi:MAG: TonB-dependent siderophore receptor [Salinisphaeraceae bacterium]|jgi:iron complex outermembrane receptor protein|nr:TonB-dependent siderophore receptor [Salinisphaeraceae bacterium]
MKSGLSTAPRPTSLRHGPFAYGMTLLLVACALVIVPGAGAQAQEQAVQEQPAAQQRDYAIGPGSLGDVLAEFAAASGLQLVVEPGTLEGQSSAGLNGPYTTRAGLTQLLAGSGYDYRLGDGTLTLVRAETGESQLAPIAVVAPLVSDRGRAGLLGERLIRDTPFSITSFAETAIDNQQAKSVADVVENDPSVRNLVGRSSNSDQFQIRGFPIFTTALAVDGLYGLSDARQMPVEAFDRVEVFKGPNTFANGVPSTGQIAGVINLELKSPTREPLTNLTLDYESDGHAGPHIDVSRRFGSDGAFGARFNGVYRDGDLALDDTSRELGLASLALEYDRGGPLRATADLFYRDQTVDAPQQLVSLAGNDFAVPDAPDSKTNPAQAFEYTDNENRFALLGVEYDLDSNWTARLRYGTSRSEEDRLSSLPRLQDSAGNTVNTLLDSGFRFDADTAEAGVTGFFGTGALEHELTIVANRLEQERFNASAFGFAMYDSNLYDPAGFAEPDPLPDPALQKSGEITFDSVGVSDIVRLWDDRLQLTGGLRYQELETITSGGGGERTKDNELSPAGGIVFKPSEPWSIYASYSEGLAPGTIVPGVNANAGEQLDAFVTEQIETGVKADFGGFGAGATLFEIKQPQEVTDPDTQILSQNGEIRNRGLELNVFGEVVEQLRLLGGMALFDAEQTSTEGGVNDGNDAVGVPDIQLNLYGEYDLPGALQGASLTARVIHTEDQFVDAANQQSIPDWTRVDLGARHQTTIAETPVIFRLDVRNLLADDYWSSAARGSLSRGVPRTLLLSTTASF